MRKSQFTQMKHSTQFPRLFLILMIPLALVGAGISTELSKPDTPEIESEQLIAIAPPPFSEDIFPCSECHFEDDEVDRTPREVDFHDTVVFEHDEENRWCLDCHDAQNRDMLHLADGRLISFEESQRLCGQCHSSQLKNWRAGDHGRRTGSWSGTKQYLLCAHCHNPHSPAFKPIEPLPPPKRQEFIK